MLTDLYRFYFYEVLEFYSLFVYLLILLYHVLTLVKAIHHIAHSSLMTYDPFLLDILEKVMDLNSVVKGTFHFPNLQIVRPQRNLKI